MRIIITTTKSPKLIPWDHQQLLTGTLHKWMGENTIHDKVSLYSFSRLTNGTVHKGGLIFSKPACFSFSAWDPLLIKQIISGILKDPQMFYGLQVEDVQIVDNPDFTSIKVFYPQSPILIKRVIDSRTNHIIFSDVKSSEYLTQTLIKKLQIAGLNDDTVNLQFDSSYTKAGTKLITYNGICNKANWCPVIITGKPETKLFAWNVGIGNSTGIGFGAIK